MTHRSTTVALAGLAGILGHHGGDYLAQDDWCARHKQERTRRGRLALAVHAATYAATQAATRAAVYRIAGHRVHPLAQLAGAATEALVHAVIDDGRLLRRFAHASGKGGFHDLADHGVNGRALLDQAAHHQVQLPAGIAVTTIVDALLRRRAGR